MNTTQPGTKVLITEDCRDGGMAAGQTGVYEGDFPLTVSFGCFQGEGKEVDWKDGEFSYDDYRSGFIKLADGRPAHAEYLEWEAGKECPRPFFAMPSLNPRIRLPDGSIIWGVECWWSVAEDGLSLEDAQKETEITKDIIRAVFSEPKTQ